MARSQPPNEPESDSPSLSGASVSRRRFLQSLATSGIALTASAAYADQGQTPPPAVGKENESNSSTRQGPPKLAVPSYVEAQVSINQVGFLPHEPKRAVIAANGPILGNSFAIVDEDSVPVTRYQGKLTEYSLPVASSHFRQYFFADFGDFTKPGRYRVRLSDGHLSLPFSIGQDVYERLMPLMLRYFDVQRCGAQKSELRETCHMDDGIIVGGPRDGQALETSGGWHDAGDYLKFVETTSYVAAVMLFAYDHYAETYHKALAQTPPQGLLPIPLQYAKIGLDWLLKMHPSSNEFYYQIGSEDDHNSWRLPESDTPQENPKWTPRTIYYGVGANLAGRTAAAFAMAARLYQPYLPSYADRCRTAAKSVYQLGLNNRQVLTTKPFDFYPEDTWQDDMEWAAASLYKTTGQQDYLLQALQFADAAGAAKTGTSVYNTHALAHYTLYPYATDAQKARLLGYLQQDVAAVSQQAHSNPYSLGTPYTWGTAEAAAGAALTCLLYSALSGDPDARELARVQRDFVLGCNPANISCLIGAGTRYALFPHHQIANIKNIELTGAIIGGPTTSDTFRKQNIPLGHVEFKTMAATPTPADDPPDEAIVYHDAVQDYVTNEPANDYTVKFLLLTAFYIDGA